jgi:hypothetical protein
MTLIELFTSIADAIRYKKESEEEISPTDFSTQIRSIEVSDIAYALISGTGTFSISNPDWTYVRPYAFANTGITGCDLPGLDLLEPFTLYDCSMLTSVNLPNVEYMDEDALSKCVRLKELYLPKCTTFNSGFDMMSNLEKFGVPNCEGDYLPPVMGARKLKLIDFRGRVNMNFIPTVEYTQGALVGTLPKNLTGKCSVVVPDALYSDFESDSGWSDYFTNLPTMYELVKESEYVEE